MSRASGVEVDPADVRATRGTDRIVGVLQCTGHSSAIAQAQALKMAPELMREALVFIADLHPDA